MQIGFGFEFAIPECLWELLGKFGLENFSPSQWFLEQSISVNPALKF